MSGIPIDPILLEVLRNRLDTIADEMELTLLKSSVSLIVKEALDASAALFTLEGVTIAQAASIPIHLGALQFAAHVRSSNGGNAFRQAQRDVHGMPRLELRPGQMGDTRPNQSGTLVKGLAPRAFAASTPLRQIELQLARHRRILISTNP